MRIYKVSKLMDSEPSEDKHIYTQCSVCKKYKDENHIFKSVEEMDEIELDTVKKIKHLFDNEIHDENMKLSHGICPECIEDVLSGKIDGF